MTRHHRTSWSADPPSLKLTGMPQHPTRLRFTTLLLLLLITLTAGCARELRVTTQSPVDKVLYRYIQHLTKKIEIIGMTRYPQLNSMDYDEDQIELAITLTHAGKLEQVKLIEPAQHAELNRIMLELVRYSAPYPPMPDDVYYDRITIHKRWHFSQPQRVKPQTR